MSTKHISTEQNNNEKLFRGIGRWDLIAIVINTVIGAGIFGLPSVVAKLIGSYSILAFFACSILIALFALCFAEVSSRFRSTGGSYLYAKRAFGDFVGFEAGWLFWITRLTAYAANSNLLVGYLSYFYDPLATGTYRVAILSLLAVGLTYINISGVRESVTTTNILTIGKLTPLLLFVVIGSFYIEPANFSFGAFPETDALGKSVLVLIYAFVGFESAVIPAGEIKDPRRNAPFSLMTAIGIIVAVYILVQVVAMGTLPELAASNRPLADAALRFVGPFGAGVIVVGAGISILGNLNVGFLAASRLLYAMSMQKTLPAVLARTHETHKTPHIAVGVTGVILVCLSYFSTFITALTISTVSRLTVYVLTFASLPLFRSRPELGDSEGYKIPFGSAVSVLSIALILVLFYFVTLAEFLQVAGAAAVGAAIYFGYRFFSGNVSAEGD